MVNPGLRDWLMRRVTAVVMALYSLFMAAFLLTHQPLQFADWSGLFGNPWMRLASLLALLCLYLHAWGGVRSILMDYVRSAAIRLTVEVLVILVLVGCAAWSVQILWGLQ
ncbi:MAG: succinate dehydrogenase, hydrophobic membrane anchor protein [Sulfuricella sp.]|nr:succinate dehydrogenase, hydrophobic membrane anchor protein [Sulfuricella sp.]